MNEKPKLKKELGLFDVYAIATGTTLSAGFFLLPGLAAVEAGPSLILAYMLATLPLIPAMFCIVELATAMPRAGGVYYFLDRSLGPYIGLIGGVGTWLALILKVTFALVGMGAYLALFFPDISQTPIALLLALAIGLLNYFGARKSGQLQIYLVLGLLILLIGFIGGGVPNIDYSHFQDIFRIESSSLLGTAGLVYISYVGVTNVASLSEEVRDPEKNLPRGVFLALGTSVLIYALGTSVMVGVVPMDRLAGDLTPVATAAGLLFGPWGVLLLSIAAILAFVSVANAGMLSASRYPLAMSRDHLFPRSITRLTPSGTPVVSLIITVVSIVILLLLFDPARIAKLASAFQLLMFALVCLAVIVMRESRLEAYDPGYRSPLYPWMQIAGIIIPLIIIRQMGWLSIIFTSGMVLICTGWYINFAKVRVIRNGAIYHIFERLGRLRYEGLDRELRGILKEKGLRDEDPFEDIVSRCQVIDLPGPIEFAKVVDMSAQLLSPRINQSVENITTELLEGTRMGATPVTHGVALPHFRAANLTNPELVIARAHQGIHISYLNYVTDEPEEGDVHAVFFLVSPEDDPGQHLRILAQIAGRVDDDSFEGAWRAARDEHTLRDVLLRHDRYVTLHIHRNTPTGVMVDKRINELEIPDGCRIMWIRRSGQVVVPRGTSVIQSQDELTVIGDPVDIQVLRKQYTA
jgi:basic amino acid/polyamine antiporter, APA family